MRLRFSAFLCNIVVEPPFKLEFEYFYQPELTGSLTNDTLYDEKTLLQRIAKGDEQAFARLYHHYYQILRPFIWKHSPTPEDAEEVIQQTFLRAWLYREQITGIENMKAWLFRVATREYLTLVRNRLTRRLQWTSLELLPEHPSQARESNEPLSFKEINELVDKAVETLSTRRKLIFQLRRRELLSVDEIASQLQLSPKTVKNTLGAAVSQVRAYLTASGYAISVLLTIALFPFQ